MTIIEPLYNLRLSNYEQYYFNDFGMGYDISVHPFAARLGILVVGGC